jgi:hypothetical protein
MGSGGRSVDGQGPGANGGAPIRRGRAACIGGRDRGLALAHLGRSHNDGGQTVVAVLETGEGYRAAAAAAVRAVESLLETPLIGALTPVQAFGADFALAVPGTRIQKLQR